MTLGTSGLSGEVAARYCDPGGNCTTMANETFDFPTGLPLEVCVSIDLIPELSGFMNDTCYEVIKDDRPLLDPVCTEIDKTASTQFCARLG